MIYVEAPAPLPTEGNRWVEHPIVFLGGGICKSPQWQLEVVRALDSMELPEFILANPRRENFPIDNPKAAHEQISWEYHALNRATIFSMWFSGGESERPICMYELGRHLVRFVELPRPEIICLGVEPGYRREQDVRIQTELVLQEYPYLEASINISGSLETHINNIAEAVRELSEDILGS